MFKPKRILVTTDFSAESDAALREAVGIGEQFRSTIYLLHVIPGITPCGVDYCLSDADISSVEARLRDDADLRMREMIKRVAPDTMAEIVKEIRFGSVVTEAVALEHERAIDLVIAAPHRQRRRWRKDTHHLLTALVNKSACETMVVR
jgi:nucleotide-binding universal stress UspA family protein